MRGGRTPDPKELVPLDHPEITSAGRLLRRLKIDELPQLINVLKGEMSLVGPRPTLPDQVAAYDDFRRQRLLARPGITGLAQVNGNATVPWDERILSDIAYVRLCSFTMDLGILLRTVWVAAYDAPVPRHQIRTARHAAGGLRQRRHAAAVGLTSSRDCPPSRGEPRTVDTLWITFILRQLRGPRGTIG